MKTRWTNYRATQGSALITTLIICAVLSVSMFGYLALVEQQSRLSARSQSWNIAIAVVEAGIEDALQHLNENRADLNTAGWSASGAFYSRSNVLADGNSYVASINMTQPSMPEITCQSYVRRLGLAQAPPVVVFAAVGTDPTSDVLSRRVRVRCARGSLFLAALAAKKQIDMKGNNILSDSFDSSSPFYSTFGQYDPTKVKDNGDVSSNDTIVNTISVGNANIYGHVATGPGGTVSVGSNGGVGSHEWQASNTGLQPGWVTHNANFTFPDTTPPPWNGSTPPAGDVVEVSYTYVTNVVTSTNAPSNPFGSTTTNVASTTGTTTYPQPPPPGMYTNVSYTDTTALPGIIPSGMLTNTVNINNSSTYPGASVSSVATNVHYTNVVSRPAYAVPDLSTNWIVITTKTYPSEGTYIGPISTNIVTSGPSSGRGTWYTFKSITGYTYAYYTYNYQQTVYRIPSYTYMIPNYSYTYNTCVTNTAYQTNYYDYILDTGKYQIPTLDGKVYVRGQAELKVTGGISMSGNDTLKIAPSGKLTAWVGGTSSSIGGNGVINKSGYAANCIIYFAPTVTSLQFGGNGEFTGIIVAPEAATKLNGGGSGDMDYIGCLMIKSVVLNGHYKFHYDEALGNMSGSGRYLITSWDELVVTK